MRRDFLSGSDPATHCYNHETINAKGACVVEEANRSTIGKRVLTILIAAVVAGVTAALAQKYLFGDVYPAVTGGVVGGVVGAMVMALRKRKS
jgi:uncharacterized membrane protein